MNLNSSCEKCLIRKYSKKYPESASSDQAEEYLRLLKKTISQNRDISAPEVVEKINAVRFKLFGVEEDYTTIKMYFNCLMMDFEPQLEQNVKSSEDPLRSAVRYAMAGNFIDFGALHSVETEKLNEFLEASENIEINSEMLEMLRTELQGAKHLVYLLDNCGEIVADKLLIKTIREFNPELRITAIVRGKPVLNDVTSEDALQVELNEAVDEVLDNGCGIAGNVLSKMSDDAYQAVKSADVIISKGQGNYETLCGCGLNIYYIFMCKCPLFVRRFNVPLFSGIITKEVR